MYLINWLSPFFLETGQSQPLHQSMHTAIFITLLRIGYHHVSTRDLDYFFSLVGLDLYLYLGSVTTKINF
jgi:hypothetical protein